MNVKDHPDILRIHFQLQKFPVFSIAEIECHKTMKDMLYFLLALSSASKYLVFFTGIHMLDFTVGHSWNTSVLNCTMSISFL